MSDVVASGLFAIIGTALGWVLSEAGAGWRNLVERRRTEQAEAAARVFDAARTAVSIGEGIRWLIQVDVDKKSIGQGFGTKEYTVKAVEVAEHIQQLHLISLAVAAKGPSSALPQVDALVAQTQALWNATSATSRGDIAQDPEPLRSTCDQVVKMAQELVRSPETQAHGLHQATTTEHEPPGNVSWASECFTAGQLFRQKRPPVVRDAKANHWPYGICAG